MKPHDPTSTPASSGRHPEAVRVAVIIGASCAACVWLAGRAKVKIERERQKHDRHVTAVKLAFSQEKIALTSSRELGCLILDLNNALHPVVFELLLVRFVRWVQKSSQFFQGFFKVGNAFFKLGNSLFHRHSSSAGVCGKPTVDEAGSGGNAAASHSDDLAESLYKEDFDATLKVSHAIAGLDKTIQDCLAAYLRNKNEWNIA
ncbi:hypothetical protein ACQ5TV_12695 [Acetobacter ghanensis]|uniref:hypothetical protein n=1 Tax=Acetobacter ghanensis TaxID=431306 RepID=UPI003D33C730